MTLLSAVAPRMICIRESWGLVCGCQSIAALDQLPDKSAPAVRKLVRSSPDGTFTCSDWIELAQRANAAGLKHLPVSVYRPRKGWSHFTIRTA